MKSMLTASVALMASFAMAQNAGPTYSIVDLGLVGATPGQPYYDSVSIPDRRRHRHSL